MVEIARATGDAPLYHKYPRQINPQDAYVELDCRTGVLSADYNGEIGNAIPSSVFHGHVQRWWVNNCLTADGVNELLDDLAPLAERIVAGYESRWDGNNYVARYTDDAEAAIEEADSLCRETSDGWQTAEVWDVGDWLFSSCSLREHWDDQRLEDAVAELDGYADSEGVFLDGDIEEALIAHALWLLDSRPKKLNRNHISTLWARGEITMHHVREWLRAINS